MTFSNYKVERIGFGLLLCVALLMAFEPLVRMHDPNGARISDAFDLPSGIKQLQSELRIAAPIKSVLYSGPAGSPAQASAATPGAMPVPFSIRTASIVPWFVFAALAFTFLALLDLLFVQKGVALLSVVGGIFAASALAHVQILSSDVQAWTDAMMSIAELSSPSDAALGARVLMANSFLISPGTGLYMITVCLLLVPLLSLTRAIPRLRDVIRSDARIRTSQKIHIRPINSQYPEETCASLDLSRSGLYLESPSNHYYVGMEVYLTRNVPAGGPPNDDEHGHVVRVEKGKNPGCRFAIHIIPKV
jgi:hypothetical protein